MFVTVDKPDMRVGLDPKIQGSPDITPRAREIALKGKLYTADDSICAGEDFSELINLRYRDVGLEGIYGMTKINTSALSAYPLVRTATQLRKSTPAEEHIVAQAFTADKTSSAVIRNSTAVPAQGPFSSSILWSDTAGASKGRFAKAPGGHLAYANGKEACIWAGDEYRVGAFLNHDPNGAFSYEWTEQVRNFLTDTQNVATQAPISGGLDANVMLLLHMDGASTDSSPTTAHTPVDTSITYSSSAPKFGTHAAVFNGTTGLITIPDDADFDLSDGTFTIDMQVKPSFAGLAGSTGALYYHSTDANNYFKIVYTNTGQITVSCFATSAEVIGTAGLQTATGVLKDGVWQHLAVVENGNDWYIFLDGKRVGYLSDNSRLANYTGTIVIGKDASNLHAGSIDELRVSSTARWIAEFDPPSAAYTTSTTRTTWYVGATRPIENVKLYMSTANTAVSTTTVDHWTGTWDQLAVTDGTSNGSVSFQKTGTIAFPSTVGTAKTKIVKGMLLYWYRITISAVDSAASIYHVSLGAPFQPIKDVWDGVNSLLQAAHLYKTAFEEYTLNIQENDYDSADSTTFVELDSLTATTQYMTFGFLSQQCGLALSIPGGHANTAVTGAGKVYYWNGLTWALCSNIDDGTMSSDSKALNQSGTITWEPPTPGLEFKRDIGREFALYYYKVVWDVALSADVQVYFARGVPAPKHLYDYDLVYSGGDRLWLIKGNTAMCSAMNTPDVFNGEDSFSIPFGDERDVSGACELYCQFGANLYAINVFTKVTETWVLYQDANGAWQKFRVSGGIGCAAADSIATANIVPEVAGQNGTIAIWQGTQGVYIFDGRVLTPIHNDIKNYFDKRKSECIKDSLIGESCGWFNEDETEYHWCFASGTSATTLNKELVFDLKKKKWFEVDRTTGKKVQLGIAVEDAYGNKYNYGFIDTGYMERLEYGTTMDGTAIPYSFALGDLALFDGHVFMETSIRGVGMACVANDTSFEKITFTHYGDTQDEGTSFEILPRNDKGRVASMQCLKFDGKVGPFVYHKLKAAITTSDENYGFRPKFMYIYYDPIKSRGI